MDAAKWLISPALAAVGLLKKPKKQDAGTPLPPVTRDSVREEADRRDALRRRRGGAADIVGSAAGWEPPSTGKVTLGS